MKFSTNVLFQILALVISASGKISGLLPGKAGSIAAGVGAIAVSAQPVISAVQALVSTIAHKSNPDGTPATEPYYPPTK